MAIKELSDLERLKLSLEYSISEKHKKSLLKRIENYGTKDNKDKDKEDKVDVVEDNSEEIGQVRFF